MSETATTEQTSKRFPLSSTLRNLRTCYAPLLGHRSSIHTARALAPTRQAKVEKTIYFRKKKVRVMGERVGIRFQARRYEAGTCLSVPMWIDEHDHVRTIAGSMEPCNLLLPKNIVSLHRWKPRHDA